MKELAVDAVLGNIDRVIDFIIEELERNNLTDIMLNEIAIAAEEVFTNIANYAYTEETGKVRLCVDINDNELRITFEDSGKPYNPLDTPEPDITLSAKERPIGGLGIFMVKKIMDTVQYRYENCINQLTMIKDIGVVQ